jgi:glycosyltransferase involved in cell wall biosynthesis
MVKNEEDVIESVLLHLLAEGIDHIIVADNMSTDGTRAILDRLAATHPIDVVDDNEPAYLQAKKMTALAHRAGRQGAEWIVPFDADEVWYSPRGRLADVLQSSKADVQVAAVYDHFPWPWQVCDTPIERLTRRRNWRSAQPKVAFRYGPQITIHGGNHGVEGWESSEEDVIAIRHFGVRGFAHLRRKSRTGKAALEAAGDELGPRFAHHWRRLGSASTPQLVRAWFDLTARRGRRRDPAPLRR